MPCRSGVDTVPNPIGVLRSRSSAEKFIEHRIIRKKYRLIVFRYPLYDGGTATYQTVTFCKIPHSCAYCRHWQQGAPSTIFNSGSTCKERSSKGTVTFLPSFKIKRLFFVTLQIVMYIVCPHQDGKHIRFHSNYIPSQRFSKSLKVFPLMPRLKKAYSFSGKIPIMTCTQIQIAATINMVHIPKTSLRSRFGHPTGIPPVTVRDRISDKQDNCGCLHGVRVICRKKLLQRVQYASWHFLVKM